MAVEDLVPSAFSAIAAGAIVPGGRFRYEATEDGWWWSDELYRIYGYEPGQVVPSTELLRSHHHPDDQHRAVHRLVTVLAREKSVSTCHRIIDAQRNNRTVVMAATALHDPLGDLVQIDGHLIDITRSLHRDRLSVDRADLVVVEQAAATLMATHSIDANRAYTLLAQVATALIRPSVEGAGADTGVVLPPPPDGATEASRRRRSESP